MPTQLIKRAAMSHETNDTEPQSITVDNCTFIEALTLLEAHRSEFRLGRIMRKNGRWSVKFYTVH